MYAIRADIPFSILDMEKAKQNGWKEERRKGKRVLTNGKTLITNVNITNKKR